MLKTDLEKEKKREREKERKREGRFKTEILRGFFGVFVG